MCPNNLLYWEAIRLAIENGFGKFDFGRSTPDEGTYRFKEQWGARPVQLHWHYLMRDNASLPELNTKNPKYQLAIKVWQRLPVSVTKLIGPTIVKNIP
jgi:lipid II:glycine glycyltransferase (peptidoglycan interpeptide bridge formation enzyme)